MPPAARLRIVHRLLSAALGLASLLLAQSFWPPRAQAAPARPPGLASRLRPRPPGLPGAQPVQPIRLPFAAAEQDQAAGPAQQPAGWGPWLELPSTHPDLAGQVRLRQAAAGLAIEVQVHDAVHQNDRSGAQIWDGDAVQLALHPVAPEESWGAAEGEVLGASDLLLTLAATPAGPAGWVHAAGNPNLLGAWPHPVAVVRDAARALTRYAATVPWAALDSAPGALRTLGLSLWLLDGGTGAVAPRRLRLGASAAGGLRPADMVALALLPPEAPFAALGAPMLGWQGAGDQLVVAVRAHGAPDGWVLRLACGDWQQEYRALPPHLDHLLEVAVPPAGCAGPLHLALRPAGSASLPAASRSIPLPQFAARLLRLQAAQGVALTLAERHGDRQLAAVLQSERALLLSLVASAQADGALAPRGELAALTQLFAALEAAYRTPAHRLQALATGRAPHLHTFVAAGDQTLQPYLLEQPYGAAGAGTDAGCRAGAGQAVEAVEAVDRPLVVRLHGRGDARLSAWLADAVTERPLPPGRTAAAANAAAPLADAYVLLPWARGNAGAYAAGAEDVLQATADVRRRYAIDPNRLYLAGFSLGASGAFALALHRPEPWAAVATVSGGSWWAGLGRGLGANVRGMPFFVWHGTRDGAVPVTEGHRIVAELRAGGAEVTAHFAAGAGHVLTPEVWRQILHFFAEHRRVSGLPFRYQADGPAARSRQGLQLQVAAALDAPWVEVHRQDHKLFLRSHNTAGLELDLGPQGLDVPAPAQVYWQGRAVWQGAAGQLQLGAGAARP